MVNALVYLHLEVERGGCDTRLVRTLRHPGETGVALLYSFLDYLLLVERKMIGVVEAKPEGTTLSGVEAQSARYGTGLPDVHPPGRSRCPSSTKTPASRPFSRPRSTPNPTAGGSSPSTGPIPWPSGSRARPPCARLLTMPPLLTSGLWNAQIEAISNLERSLADDKPRSLIQMATGSGMTVTAISFIHRLIKFAKARRVLFLVDRSEWRRLALSVAVGTLWGVLTHFIDELLYRILRIGQWLASNTLFFLLIVLSLWMILALAMAWHTTRLHSSCPFLAASGSDRRRSTCAVASRPRPLEALPQPLRDALQLAALERAQNSNPAARRCPRVHKGRWRTTPMHIHLFLSMVMAILLVATQVACGTLPGLRPAPTPAPLALPHQLLQVEEDDLTVTLTLVDGDDQYS